MAALVSVREAGAWWVPVETGYPLARRRAAVRNLFVAARLLEQFHQCCFGRHVSNLAPDTAGHVPRDNRVWRGAGRKAEQQALLESARPPSQFRLASLDGSDYLSAPHD